MFRRILIISVCFGCGAAPPPPAPVLRSKLKTLAPQLVKDPFAKANKTYVILSNGELPDEDAVERLFAKKTTMAEVGSSIRGIEVSLPGVLCAVDPTEKPKDAPRHFLPNEVKPHGLSDGEAKDMSKAKRAYLVKCEPHGRLPPRGVPEQAEVAAEVVAELTDGWIHDTHTGRYWPRAEWRRLRAAASRYDTKRLIRILSAKDEAGQWLVATRGLASFGKPDMVAYPVSDEQVDRFGTAMVAIADLLIEEKNVGAGYELSMGAVTARFLPLQAYLQSTGSTPPKLAERARGKVLREYAIADPNAEIGNGQQYRAFIRRLLVR